MKKCKFCGTFGILSKCKQPEEIKIKYSAALVCKNYRDGEYCGRNTRYDYKLNYCPECGRKINPNAAEEAQE